MPSLSRRPLVRPAVAAAGLTLVAVGLTPTGATATPPAPPAPELELLGEAQIPTGTQFGGTELGGLSGIAYDAENGRYLAISDDRSDRNDARYYELSIDLGDGSLGDGDVTPTGVTTLTEDGVPYPQGSIDPEGIALTGDGGVLVSSEGDARNLIAPFVKSYDATGEETASFAVPESYNPTEDGSSGIRNNLALEPLTRTPSGAVVTGTENALAQDGPEATLEEGSPSRIAAFNADSRRPIGQYVYLTAPVPDQPIPAGSFATNGLVELLALDDNSFLAMERAFSNGVGNDVRLYTVELDESRRIRGTATTANSVEPLDKKLLAHIEDDFGIVPDNLEGMTFGPPLPDGRRTLILVSDNNFSSGQVTQFIAFALS